MARATVPAEREEGAMVEVHEVRDYHFRGDMAAYARWWRDAYDVIARHCDVVGVWLDAGEPARIGGSDPTPLPLGSANVTWIIRWRDMDHRERGWSALGDDPDWAECRARHPGFDLYAHMSSRFMVPLATGSPPPS